MRKAIMMLTILGLAVTVFSQEAVKTASTPEIRKVPVKYTSPASGKEMFNAYCASCHGMGAKGDGPAAPALKSAVPDLTTLTKENQGTFPALKVFNTIAGQSPLPSHGSSDMPVWGPVFLRIGDHGSAQAQLRVRNLTNYIESLQQK